MVGDSLKWFLILVILVQWLFIWGLSRKASRIDRKIDDCVNEIHQRLWELEDQKK